MKSMFGKRGWPKMYHNSKLKRKLSTLISTKNYHNVCCNIKFPILKCCVRWKCFSKKQQWNLKTIDKTMKFLSVTTLKTVKFYSINLSVLEKLVFPSYLFHFWFFWKRCMIYKYTGLDKFWEAPDFSGAQILPCKKEKSLDLQIYSWICKTMKKL